MLRPDCGSLLIRILVKTRSNDLYRRKGLQIVVAQELVAHGRRLFYHTWPKEGANRNYEIDFIVADGKKICPIEVKSSRHKAHASLDCFAEKFSSRVGKQYLVYTKDIGTDGAVICLPTYMACFL